MCARAGRHSWSQLHGQSLTTSLSCCGLSKSMHGPSCIMLCTMRWRKGGIHGERSREERCSTNAFAATKNSWCSRQRIPCVNRSQVLPPLWEPIILHGRAPLAAGDPTDTTSGEPCAARQGQKATRSCELRAAMYAAGLRTRAQRCRISYWGAAGAVERQCRHRRGGNARKFQPKFSMDR